MSGISIWYEIRRNPRRIISRFYAKMIEMKKRMPVYKSGRVHDLTDDLDLKPGVGPQAVRTMEIADLS